MDQIKLVNRKRAQQIERQKERVDQRQLSKSLVLAFKQSVEQVKSEKAQRNDLAMQTCFAGNGRNQRAQAQTLQVGKEPGNMCYDLLKLSATDKKRILENFIENDEALG